MSRRFTVRFSDHTAMQVEELAGQWNKSVSTIIKCLLLNSLNVITDKDGDYLITDKRSPSVFEVMAGCLSRLKQMCISNRTANYNGRTLEDVFSETILDVAQDRHAVGMNEEELVRLFAYKYNEHLFRSRQNSKVYKEVPYADNKQTKENNCETY